MTRFAVSAALALALASTAAFAQTAGHDHHATHMAASQSEELTPAEVRSLDLKARKVILRHGELKNLGMPGMTMPFALAAGLKLPADLKVGDKVFVRVEDLGGSLTVTTLKR